MALAEVAAGGLLLAVALGGIIGLSAAAMASQAQGRELIEAAMLADEQLAMVLARGPDDYASRFEVRGVCDEPFARYRFELSFDSAGLGSGSGSGSGAARASADGGTGGGGSMDPYRVTATIFWQGRGGRERSIDVQTLIASRLGDESDPDRRPVETTERVP